MRVPLVKARLFSVETDLDGPNARRTQLRNEHEGPNYQRWVHRKVVDLGFRLGRCTLQSADVRPAR
jgi:hypothetical protein